VSDHPTSVANHHPARLTYDAATEKLTGWVGTIHFNEIAYSGGGRGHKSHVSHAQATRYLHDSPATTLYGRLATTQEVYDKKTDTYSKRGGTIPPGHYRCVYTDDHATFHQCIFLRPLKDAHAIHSPFAITPIVHNRGGFFIHGHGPKGSDGCIVLENEQRRKVLNQAIKDFPRSVILEVIHVSYMLPAEIGGVIA
jgi:hypothetical protein